MNSYERIYNILIETTTPTAVQSWRKFIAARVPGTKAHAERAEEKAAFKRGQGQPVGQRGVTIGGTKRLDTRSREGGLQGRGLSPDVTGGRRGTDPRR